MFHLNDKQLRYYNIFKALYDSDTLQKTAFKVMQNFDMVLYMVPSFLVALLIWK